MIEKTNNMLTKLNSQGIKVYAIVTDSVVVYAASRYINKFVIFYIFIIIVKINKLF